MLVITANTLRQQLTNTEGEEVFAIMFSEIDLILINLSSEIYVFVFCSQKLTLLFL